MLKVSSTIVHQVGQTYMNYYTLIGFINLKQHIFILAILVGYPLKLVVVLHSKLSNNRVWFGNPILIDMKRS